MSSAPTRAGELQKETKSSALGKHVTERRTRLEKIRAEVEKGTYRVDATELSKAIINRHLGK